MRRSLMSARLRAFGLRAPALLRSRAVWPVVGAMLLMILVCGGLFVRLLVGDADDRTAVIAIVAVAPVLFIVGSLSSGSWIARWQADPCARMFPPGSAATMAMFRVQIISTARRAVAGCFVAGVVLHVVVSRFDGSGFDWWTTSLAGAVTTMAVVLAIPGLASVGLSLQSRVTKRTSTTVARHVAAQALTPLPAWLGAGAITLGASRDIDALDERVVLLVVAGSVLAVRAAVKAPTPQRLHTFLTSDGTVLDDYRTSDGPIDLARIAWMTVRRSTRETRRFWSRTIGLVVPVAVMFTAGAALLSHEAATFTGLLYALTGSLYFLDDVPELLFGRAEIDPLARRYLTAGRLRKYVRERRRFQIRLLGLGVAPLCAALWLSTGLVPMGVLVLATYAVATVAVMVALSSIALVVRFEHVGGAGPASLIQKAPIFVCLVIVVPLALALYGTTTGMEI